MQNNKSQQNEHLPMLAVYAQCPNTKHTVLKQIFLKKLKQNIEVDLCSPTNDDDDDDGYFL